MVVETYLAPESLRVDRDTGRSINQKYSKEFDGALGLGKVWLQMEVKGHKIEPRADLAGADLAFAALQGANLEGANLEGANLEGANLEGANLSGASLSRANLAYANLEGADLTSANLQGSILEEADLSGANLTDAVVDAIFRVESPQSALDYHNIVRANLIGANLTGADLTRANLNLADLSDADLRDAVLEGTQFEKALFRNANLEGADLKSMDLRFVDFTNAILTGARLVGSNLKGAILRNADASGANLESADLKGTDCSNANLEDAILAKAKLEKTVFQCAKLTGADLSKALVLGTNFKGAQLNHAVFESATFSFPDFTDAVGVDKSIVEEAGRFLSQKSKRVLGALLGALLVVFSVGVVVRGMASRNREEAEREVTALADKYCDDVKSLADKQSINDRYEQFRQEAASVRYFDELDNYMDLERPAFRCLGTALDKLTPKTVPKPVEKSDAEIAAEGRSCDQQWRRARSETLSGSLNDVQLRATVYACDTPSEWVLGAVDNGEYSDALLDVICALESKAPACG